MFAKDNIVSRYDRQTNRQTNKAIFAKFEAAHFFPRSLAGHHLHGLMSTRGSWADGFSKGLWNFKNISPFYDVAKMTLAN